MGTRVDPRVTVGTRVDDKGLAKGWLRGQSLRRHKARVDHQDTRVIIRVDREGGDIESQVGEYLRFSRGIPKV